MLTTPVTPHRQITPQAPQGLRQFRSPHSPFLRQARSQAGNPALENSALHRQPSSHFGSGLYALPERKAEMGPVQRLLSRLFSRFAPEQTQAVPEWSEEIALLFQLPETQTPPPKTAYRHQVAVAAQNRDNLISPNFDAVV